jgi:hypothetical protein
MGGVGPLDGDPSARKSLPDPISRATTAIGWLVSITS